MSPINLAEKLALFSEHWSPRVVAQMNDVQFKLAEVKGEFVWHHHDDTESPGHMLISAESVWTLSYQGGEGRVRWDSAPRSSFWPQVSRRRAAPP